MSGVRTRIAPAPSGDLHVGNVRTALFSWAFARRHEGKFLLRVEDTDAARATDEGYEATQEILHWIGIDWDEGPGVGGPYAPYRQSERRARSTTTRRRARSRPRATVSTPAGARPRTIAARKAAAGTAGKTPGYDGFCKRLSSRRDPARRSARPIRH